MRRNTRVSRRPHQTFTAFNCYMLPRFEIFVFFCQSKIDYVHYFCLLLHAYCEIISFDVSMHESFPMDLLESCDYLDTNR